MYTFNGRRMADYRYIFRAIMERMKRKALVIFPLKTDTRHSYKEELYLVENDTIERKKNRIYRETDTLYCSTKENPQSCPRFSSYPCFIEPQTKKTASASHIRCIPAFAHMTPQKPHKTLKEKLLR